MRRTFGAQQFCDRFNNCPRQFFFRRLDHALPLPASKTRFFPSPFIVSRFFVSHNRSARIPKYKSVAQRPRTRRRPFRDASTGLLQYHILQNSSSPPREQKTNVRWCNNNNNNVHAECRRETSMLRCRTAAAAVTRDDIDVFRICHYIHLSRATHTYSVYEITRLVYIYIYVYIVYLYTR